MSDFSSESEINDLRKQIVSGEQISDDTIRDAIAFMRSQRSNDRRSTSSRSTNKQEVDLDDLLSKPE